MHRSLLIALAVVVGVALVVVAWWFFTRPSLLSPEELAEIALNDESPQERERAAAQLLRHGDESLDELREVFAKTDTPEVRAICVQALAALRDYDSMEEMLEAMEDPAAVVRSRAGRAVMQLLGAKYEFDAEAEPEIRQETIDYFRGMWEKYKGSEGFREYVERMQRRGDRSEAP